MMDHQSSIHNCNMLGAAFLARAAKCTSDSDALEVAKCAMEYSCTRQLSDGSWWYGEHPKYHWVDNFHTGYNLDSLKYYMDASGDETWKKCIEKGLEYYKNNFFEVTGMPKYYNNRTYPIDSQCAGQAIETLALFGKSDESALELACKVARWWIDNMQDKNGHYYFRYHPMGIKAKTPMMHWAQAVLCKGLTNLEANMR